MTETAVVPRRTLRSQLRALPAPAWILFAGTFVNRFGTFVMPLLVIYLTRQGFSATQAGVALAAYGAGHLVASALGGHMADRIGRRNTIAVSMFASAIAMVALSQAKTYLLIVILTFLAGSASELYRPASHALIGDLIPPEQRIIAFGMYRFAVNLGFAAGPATAGFLADESFFLVFIGDAITSVGYGIIALAFLPHGLRSWSKEERFGEATRVALSDRRFVLFLMATALAATIDFQMGSTFALHVQDLGFPTKTYGLLISLNGLLIILFEMPLTNWIQRMNPQPIIALGYLLAGLGFALTGFASTVPALAMTVVVWTVGEMISSPMAGGYVTTLAPERYRGRYLGLFVLMWSFGMVAGPTLGTAAFERNPWMVWIGCGVLGVAAAGLMLIRPRSRQRKLPL